MIEAFRNKVQPGKVLFVIAGLGVALAIGAFVWRTQFASNAVSNERTGDAAKTTALNWIDRARDYVQSEVAYAKGSNAAAAKPMSEGEQEVFLATTAVRYVANRLSPLRYGYLVEIARTFSNSSAAICMEVEAGICGNQVDAAIQLIRAVGLKARSVQFYWTGPNGPASHIVLEAYAGGKWRMIDATWGAWFVATESDDLNIASLADLQANSLLNFNGRPAFERRVDETSPALLTARRAGNDVFAYLQEWNDKVTLVGMSGEVPLVEKRVPDAQRWFPAGRPNFVGRTFDHGELSAGTVSAKLSGAEPGTKAVVLEGAVGACQNGDIVLSNDAGHDLARIAIPTAPAAQWTLKLPERHIGGTMRIGIEPRTDNACYVVFTAMRGVLTASE